MNGWVLFALFVVVGLGMLVAGLVYGLKEKNDPESVKIYRVITIIGAVLAAAAVLVKFVI